ncbi:histone acetyltransferase [Pancytospora philotis]|nr:histone acetyltransferase [Pancytospora philotis]
MDLFSRGVLSKLKKEEDAYERFHSEAQSLRIVSAADRTTPYRYLLTIKDLFQHMLPKMPREYIMRQVFDDKHSILVLSDADAKIIGAVCYRPVYEREFVEIVFLAVTASCHISGYGTFLFSCFKEACKLQYNAFLAVGEKYKCKNITISDLIIFGSLEDSTAAFWGESKTCDGVVADDPASVKTNPEQSGADPAAKKPRLTDGEPAARTAEYASSTILYLLTYADNSATGFFKKQGFTQWPVSTSWVGYIKDYDGGLLMEGKVYKSVDYLHKRALIEGIRGRIFKEMESINEYHVLRNDIDAARDRYGACTPSSDRAREDFLRDFLLFVIASLQADSSAWPFLEPVDTSAVPDYLSVIERPMDLSTMLDKHRAGAYSSLKELAADVQLMVGNCLTYNTSTTQYYKCGENIKMAFDRIMEKYKDAVGAWGYAL